MGKANHREVTIRSTDAAVVARWLRGTAIPAMRKMPVTVLGGGYGETIKQMERLADVLTRKAVRKRQTLEFSAQIEIEGARAFAWVVSLCRPAWPLRYDPAIIRLTVAMRDGGARKRRGRNSLTRADVSARVSGNIAVEERHRMRLSARDRQSAARDIWFAELHARGETIMTSTVPFSKI